MASTASPDPERGRARPGPGEPSGVRRKAEATARWTSQAARATGHRIRRATTAEGAGETGLSKIIELHAVSAACDAFIAVSLAGTLFFSVPTGEARGKVALYLLLTMAPFILVAPVVGPLLDKLRHGRRAAIASTFAMRAFLAWVMADAVADGAIALYPAAFGALIASKAYVLARSSCVPRLLPEQVSLVKANSRISLAGVAGVAVATPIAAAVSQLGSEWSLRLTFVVGVIGTILAARLPAAVDSTEGEVDARVLSSQQRRDPLDWTPDRAEAWADRWAPGSIGQPPPEQPVEITAVGGTDPPAADQSKRRRLGNVGAAVVMGLRANAAIRGMSGFLTVFMLFLVRDEPLGSMSTQLSVVALGAAAVLGSLIGSVLGNRFRTVAPEPIIVAILGLAAIASLVTALLYQVVTALVLAVVAAFSQQLGKLALDAQIQRDVPERVRASAFARVETGVQLAWVLGGAIGIALPLNHTLGLAILAAVLLATCFLVGRSFVELVRTGQTSVRRRPAG